MAIQSASGTYRVFYNLHDPRAQGGVQARGWFVRDSPGSYSTYFLGEAPISRDRAGEMVEIARFEIGPDGALVDRELGLW